MDENTRFDEAFEDWSDSKKATIAQLRLLADELDKNCKYFCMVAGAGIVLSAIGGTLIVSGMILKRFSFGLSAPIIAAGEYLSIFGATTNTVAPIMEVFYRIGIPEKVQGAINKSVKRARNINDVFIKMQDLEGQLKELFVRLEVISWRCGGNIYKSEWFTQEVIMAIEGLMLLNAESTWSEMLKTIDSLIELNFSDLDPNFKDLLELGNDAKNLEETLRFLDCDISLSTPSEEEESFVSENKEETSICLSENNCCMCFSVLRSVCCITKIVGVSVGCVAIRKSRLVSKSFPLLNVVFFTIDVLSIIEPVWYLMKREAQPASAELHIHAQQLESEVELARRTFEEKELRLQELIMTLELGINHLTSGLVEMFERFRLEIRRRGVQTSSNQDALMTTMIRNYKNIIRPEITRTQSANELGENEEDEANSNSLTVLSVNVNGLRDFSKLFKFLYMFFQRHHDIIFLQETHFANDLQTRLSCFVLGLYGLPFNDYGTCFNAGVTTVISYSFFNRQRRVSLQVDRTRRHGRCKCVCLTILQKKFHLVNVYAPATRRTDRRNFFQQLQGNLHFHPSAQVIMGGDFNVKVAHWRVRLQLKYNTLSEQQRRVVRQELPKYVRHLFNCGKHQKCHEINCWDGMNDVIINDVNINPMEGKYATELAAFANALSLRLVDMECFTYAHVVSRNRSEFSVSRLDLFFIKSDVEPNVEVEHGTRQITDHSGISLVLNWVVDQPENAQRNQMVSL